MAEFVVLAKLDGSNRTLACGDQRDRAIAHGFSVLEFEVDASTRARARAAWDSHRSGHEREVHEGDGESSHGLEPLSEAERAAVVGLVTALVARDREALERAGAYESPGADPFLWTESYGRWGRVDLVLPPGDPQHWSGGVFRGDEPGWAAVIVDMWTAQEGPSDLSLEADLWTNAEGGVSAQFGGLHVM